MDGNDESQKKTWNMIWWMFWVQVCMYIYIHPGSPSRPLYWNRHQQFQGRLFGGFDGGLDLHGVSIPGSSRCVKLVPFHRKNLQKGTNFTYLEDPGIVYTYTLRRAKKTCCKETTKKATQKMQRWWYDELLLAAASLEKSLQRIIAKCLLSIRMREEETSLFGCGSKFFWGFLQ